MFCVEGLSIDNSGMLKSINVFPSVAPFMSVSIYVFRSFSIVWIYVNEDNIFFRWSLYH